MFYHKKELQFESKPDKPDPMFAKHLQELIGGQFGEMSVAMQYLFQGWSTRGNEKYKDLILDTGAEEIGHIEMLATMVARLLDGAPVDEQEKAAKDPVVGAVLGGMNPKHAIVTGLGAAPEDSAGIPWSGKYIIASGNLLADMRANVSAESQGRVQASRLYEITGDPGVRKMLSFLIARDTMHQNQWLAAIKDLEEKEGVIAPSTVTDDMEQTQFSHRLINFSEGDDSSTLEWMSKVAPDGKGEFEYEREPKAYGDKPMLNPAPGYMHGTPPFEDKQ